MRKQLEVKLKKAKKASEDYALIKPANVDIALRVMARELVRNAKAILRANAKDIKKRKPNDPLIDRLMLNEERIKEIAGSLREIVTLPNPVGEVYDCLKRESLKICKQRVPMGVIGVIYESRPNVTVDVAALCLKSMNSVVLKGGEESDETNKVLVKILRGAIKKAGLPEDFVVMLDSYDRSAVKDMIKAHGLIDLVIPRGGKGLINFVRKETEVPVIETGAGVCHTYVDYPADREMAASIVANAKIQRPTVCNALDTLVIHKKSSNLLPSIVEDLRFNEVEIYADPRSHKVLQNIYPKDLLKKARPSDFGKEYLSLKMSIKTVDSLKEAIDFIREHSSGHSEAIVTNNVKGNGALFQTMVDAAAVYINASTRFTDGGVFGLGAEIGISTQKLHARGPMGLRELTTYKWVITGEGEVRK